MEAVECLFKAVIERYLYTGASQYLRDYRRTHSLKKSAEIRKRVLQSNDKRKVRMYLYTVTVLIYSN